MKHNLNSLATLPPKVLLHMFDALIRRILLYGSDVWGVQTQGAANIEKVFFCYMRCALHVKFKTSNMIVVGEYRQIPPVCRRILRQFVIKIGYKISHQI